MTRLASHATAALVASLLSAFPAGAAEVSVTPCAEGPRADQIAEPWEDNIATYAEGKVRVAAIDTIEPAAVPFHVMILTPPLDEVGGRLCRMVSQSPGAGFFGLDFTRREAKYVQGRGLVITVPVTEYDTVTEDGVAALLTIDVDQSTGKVTAKTAR